MKFSKLNLRKFRIWAIFMCLGVNEFKGKQKFYFSKAVFVRKTLEKI